nr:hypothetical protein [Tanacetum cinerariifolium]
QQNPEQIDEEFTTTAYPNVQENLKLPTEDQLIFEDPASSTGTLSSLQNLDTELSFTNQLHSQHQQQHQQQQPQQSQNNNFSTTTSSTTTKHHRSDPIVTHCDLPAVDMKPPPPPPPAGASGAPGTSGASGSSQLPLPPPHLSTSTSRSAQQQESSPTNSMLNDDSILDEQVQLSDDEDTRNDQLPKADMRKDWWKPLPEEERSATLKPVWTILSSNMSNVENNWAIALSFSHATPAENSWLAKSGDITTFINWYCRKVNKTLLTQAYFEGQAYEVAKDFYQDVVHLQFQMEECHKLLNDQIDWVNPGDLEYLRYGNKGSRPTLSISKMKVARYPDFGLELLVPKQLWIDDVCTYDISAKYGISYWWFNRQKFYIDRHDSPSRRKEV